MTSEDFHDALYRERCRIAALEAKVRELEVERDELKADAEMYEGYPGIAHDFETTKRELAASRQQVERLVEALNAFPERTDHPRFMVDHLHATIKRQEALAAVEKERGTWS